MTNDRHFTTRRGFVGAMGFGALGLYATWAAYGASPLPFGAVGSSGAPDPHAGHGGPAEPASGEPHEVARLSPAEFEKQHADFLKAHRQADGSVRPLAAAPHDEAPHDEAAHGAASHAGHAGHTPVPPAAAGHDAHGAHGTAAPSTVAVSPPPAPTHSASAHDDAPIEVYLSAGRFAFEPDDLRLEKGRTYRFHMMATDVAHGASIAFGSASRIVRLRPDTVTTLDLTFRDGGRHLVYCTVYCGPGHDAMHASITVA